MTQRKIQKNTVNLQFKYLRRLPLLVISTIILGTSVFVFKYHDRITVDNIINFIPDNLFSAGLILLILFAVKSLSVVFPLSALYLASGILFPGYIAVLISSLGLVIAVSVPYFIGSLCGNNLIVSITEKYPKISEVERYQQNNPFFICFITRMAGFLPSDVLSLYLGACKIRYSLYVSASLAGSMLSILTTTLVGSQLDNPMSEEFISVLLCRILVTVFSIIIHKKTSD